MNKQKRNILITLGFLFLFLLLPNIKAGLKIIGFLERDFVASETGAIFETKSEKSFKAFFGKADDNKIPTISLIAEGKKFDLTVLENTESIPTPTPQEPVSTISAELSDSITSSPSAITSGPKYKTIEDGYLEVSRIQGEIASLSSSLSKISGQIEGIEKDVSNISYDVAKSLGLIEQSFFGPYEMIKRRGLFSGQAEISFYIDKHKLIEKWQITGLKNNKISFLFQSDDLNFEVNKNQDWGIFSESQPIMYINTKLYDVKNKEISLEVVEKEEFGKSATGHEVTLLLPEEIVNDKNNFPLTLVREYSPTFPTSQTPQMILEDIIGEEVTSFTTNFVGSQPKFIARKNDYLVVADTTERRVVGIKDQEVTALLTNVDVNGLSCKDDGCVLSTENKLLSFDPTIIATISADIDKEKMFKELEVSEKPIGGIAVSGDTILTTSLVSPNGSLYLRHGITNKDEKTLTNLSFPELPSINQNGNLFAFFADGQLQFLGKDLPNESIPISQKPISYAFGQDNHFYIILKDERFDQNIIVRLTPTFKPEVLIGIRGNFLSVLPEENGLTIGMKLDENTGAVITLPWNKLRWERFE
jgi:hypothetical protein